MAAVKIEPRKPSDSIDPPPPSLSKFLHKFLVVVVVIILVPLFPSRAPDFINQSFFTRGWELLHLLFVGIAVCYGLFSRRNNEEPQKEALDGSSFETSVSRFLRASSSVFDDQLETLDGENDDETRSCYNDNDNISSVQSWSSQYSRNEPVVVVAADETGSAVGEQSSRMVSRNVRSKVLGLNDKPLLLPVRSLKSTRVLDSGRVDGNPMLGRSNSIRGSNEVEDSNVVLRSPIPWRSRSGRIEMKEEAEGFGVADEYAFRPVVRSDPQRGIKSDSTSSTPKSLFRSPSVDLSNRPPVYTHLVSPELLSKEVEDGLRSKGHHKPSPPPAPPLPPPNYHKPESLTIYSRAGRGGIRVGMASQREFARDTSGEESGRSAREEIMRRLSQRNSGSNFGNAPIVVKSVRTERSGESPSLPKGPKEAGTEGYCKDVMEAPKVPIRSERMLPGSKQRDKPDQVMNIPEVPIRKEEKVVPEDIVTVESDCESESEDENEASDSLSSLTSNRPLSVNQALPDSGPDVDKKADEFIAKFREQIRLQRIESIKRSTNQVNRKVT